MINRYSRPVMSAVFTEERKLELWLRIELLVAQSMAEMGQIPNEPVEELTKSVEVSKDALIDPASIAEIEAKTRHDVIAFLTHVERICGENARFLHLGMTSSDLLDTCLSLQMKEAFDLVLKETDSLIETLAERAQEHAFTLTMGRSHGIYAEPVTFGLKLAGFCAEFKRQRERLREAQKSISVCAVSGAVGTFANIDPAIEARVAKELGLEPDPHSTQVIARDRHAHAICALAQLGSSIERLATEVRHLQRSEVREAEEFFHKGQKGSSAMPHKRNPVLSENLTGLARLLRSYAIPALENVVLWHERDISHSSVERVMVPDAFILADFALARLTSMMKKLTVYPDHMQHNLDQSFGLHQSQRVLLALVEKGLQRQQAYEMVQECAMEAWQSKENLNRILLKRQEIVALLGEEQLEQLFDERYHTRHIPMIINRSIR